MKRVTVAELRHRLAAWLRRAETGERIIVERRGMPVAEILPPTLEPGGAEPISPLAREPVVGAAAPLVERPGLEPRIDAAVRLKLFDEATARQRERQRSASFKRGSKRGWTREDLYDRGRAR